MAARRHLIFEISPVLAQDLIPSSCCSCSYYCWGDAFQKSLRRRPFKMAATMSARRLLHMQQRVPTVRYPTEGVWRHWLAMCATVPDS